MIKRQFKIIIKSFLSGVHNTAKHDGIEHAGYISFLLMLSVFPFVVFLMAIVGRLGSDYIADNLIDLMLNGSLANFIWALKPRIIEITSTPPQSLLTFVILSAVWTSSPNISRLICDPISFIH